MHPYPPWRRIIWARQPDPGCRCASSYSCQFDANVAWLRISSYCASCGAGIYADTATKLDIRGAFFVGNIAEAQHANAGAICIDSPYSFIVSDSSFSNNLTRGYDATWSASRGQTIWRLGSGTKAFTNCLFMFVTNNAYAPFENIYITGGATYFQNCLLAGSPLATNNTSAITVNGPVLTSINNTFVDNAGWAISNMCGSIYPLEPPPSGWAINMGAYGNTIFASRIALNGAVLMVR